MNESRKITVKYLRTKSKKPKQKHEKLADDTPFLYAYDVEDTTGESVNSFLFRLKKRIRQRVLEGSVSDETFKSEFVAFLRTAGGKVGPFGYTNVLHPLRVSKIWKVCYEVLKESVGEAELIRVMDQLVEAMAEYNDRVPREKRERLLDEEFLEVYFHLFDNLGEYDEAYARLSAQLSNTLHFTENTPLNGYTAYAAYKIWLNQQLEINDPCFDSIHVRNAIKHFEKCFETDFLPSISNFLFVETYLSILEQIDRERATLFIKGMTERCPRVIELKRIYFEHIGRTGAQVDESLPILKQLVESDWTNEEYFGKLKELYEADSSTKYSVEYLEILLNRLTFTKDEASWQQLVDILKMKTEDETLRRVFEQMVPYLSDNSIYLSISRIFLGSDTSQQVDLYLQKHERSFLTEEECDILSFYEIAVPAGNSPPATGSNSQPIDRAVRRSTRVCTQSV